MAEGLNRWMGLGNLCADPELHMSGGGTAILKLRLACNESYLDRDKQRKERTEFINITMFGRRAEALGKFLSKGSRLFVEGSIRTSSYDDREGNKRYRTEIVASNVILADSKRDAPRRDSRREPEQTGFEDGYVSPEGDLQDDSDPIPF